VQTEIEFQPKDERLILLKRFFYSDRDFYKIGKACGIPWFDSFDVKFTRDNYAYFSDDERRDALDLIINIAQDDLFANAINSIFFEKPRYFDIDVFVGKYYYFNKDIGIKPENKQTELILETKRAIKETKGRGMYFLKALIELYKEKKWDKVYHGATWEDMLAKIRMLKGPYPSPRDLVILKSFKIYFKTGSRRYPTHTIPEEMIPVIEQILSSISREV
jgi:hypothetical protein